MTSNAATVEEYLAELPEDRRAAMTAVREAILKHLPKGYEEGISYGMVWYCVPKSIFPDGYHCDPKQPLPFAGMGNQKNYMSLYLHFLYGDDESRERFEKAWAGAGKRLDMGKACVRFKKLDDVSLDVIGEVIASAPLDEYVARYVQMRDSMKSRKK